MDGPGGQVADETAAYSFLSSPTTAAWDDVHDHDQRDDDHRSDGDDGNRGRSEDHARRSVPPDISKNLGDDWDCGARRVQGEP